MEWLLEIWEKVKESVNAIGSSLSTAVTQVDAVEFNNGFYVSKVLANIHYIVGTPVYLMLILLLQIGVGFMIWVCFKTILSIINQLTPKIKGKLTLPGGGT